MFGIEEFTASSTRRKPDTRGGRHVAQAGRSRQRIVVRQMMRVTMSCDHRVIDGATGAKFLQTVKKILENPLLLVV